MIRLIFFITLVLLFVFEKSSSHVQHYKNIKYLKYNLYLNEVLIGYHSFKFDKNNGILVVNGEGSFNVSKLGVDLIKYQTNSEAVYKGNELLKFNSNTIQNGKKKYVTIVRNENILNINGSSFKGTTEDDVIISSWWNHQIVKSHTQISSISGRIIKQLVKYLGKEKIIIDNKGYEAINFHFFSNNNQPMKDKKLNIKIWYDVETLIWLKASYEKFGTWEYRIAEVKY